jgi:hypothetical protein
LGKRGCGGEGEALLQRSAPPISLDHGQT